MAQLEAATVVAPSEPFSVPYPPSWVDRFIAWVARLPGPAWLTYLGMAAGLFAVYLLVALRDGAPPGTALLPFGALATGTGFYYLAAIHYLDDVARDAMERFRPAIEAPDWRVAELEYRLTTMPPKWVWLMTLIGIAEGLLTVAGIGTGVLAYPGPSPFTSVPATVVVSTIAILLGVTFVVGVYHSVHQLRTVSLIYTELTKVDLFRQRPLHAFARLAAFTVAAWIMPQYFWMTGGLESAAFGVAVGFFFTVMLLAVITFTWPLLGIHRLLVAEKDRLHLAASQRLQHCLHAFDQALARDDLAQIDAISKALQTAEQERQIIDALPTWPWQTGMLRSAVTAILLPLVLWLATRLLERFLGP